MRADLIGLGAFQIFQPEPNIIERGSRVEHRHEESWIEVLRCRHHRAAVSQANQTNASAKEKTVASLSLCELEELAV